jgi:Peptidase_C39 like family
MAFLLLLLLAAIALVITLAGYLLTPRSQPRNQRAAYSADPYSNRSSRRVPARSIRQPVVARRTRAAVAYTDYVEQNTWLDMWQSLVTPRLFRRRPGEPTPWVGITLVLLSVFLLGMFLMRTLMPNATLSAALAWPYASVSTSSSSSNNTSNQLYVASKNLIRLSQLDPAQYNTTQEYNLWAYSACSTAAMTEVINAYGHHYRITDLLKVESQIHEITPELGLLEDVGIAQTVTHFGFKTSWGHNLSLNNVINTANHGRPVIVSFPPDRYPGGHLVVVIGGDSNNVRLADSSIWNRRVLSRTQFMQWWEGFYAIVTPK